MKAIENSNSSSAGSIKDPVDHLRRLLNKEPVLLPITAKTKACKRKGWQTTTYTETLDDSYDRELRLGNIGVLLGKASNHLCAIDIDKDDAVEGFLELNPSLKNTLITRGARGVQIWVRVSGEYPKTTKIETLSGEAWGEWRADRSYSVIHGRHPQDVPYTFRNETTPLEMKFDAIIWPEHLNVPRLKTPYEQLVADHGEPLVVTAQGKVKEFNMMFFVQMFMLRHRVIHDPHLQQFYRYMPVTGLWETVTPAELQKIFLDDIAEVAVQHNLPDLHLKRTCAVGKSLVDLLAVESCKAFRDEKKDPVIHASNGMVKLNEDGKVTVLSFHPDFMSRNMCPFPVDFNADCPQFKKELLEAALESDDILLIQKFSGACLLGRNDAQKVLLIEGTPGGGKSTLMNVIEAMIGPANVGEMRIEHLGNPFELAAFAGKTLLTGKDVSATALRNKSAYRIKSLVGNDRIAAEKKGVSEHLNLIGNFNIAITSNASQNLDLQKDGGAWARRLMIVRYERPATSHPVPNLAEKLIKEEGPGILKWMIEGAVLLQEDLKKHGTYALSERQVSRVQQMLERSDSLRLFIKGQVIRNQDGFLRSACIKEQYLDFCADNGLEPLPPREINIQLAPLMRAIHHANARQDISGGRGYKHFALRGGEQDVTA